jgi:hypothetical protein
LGLDGIIRGLDVEAEVEVRRESGLVAALGLIRETVTAERPVTGTASRNGVRVHGACIIM